MFYRRRKGFFYYFKALLCVLIAGYAIYYLYQKNNRIDADKILAQSVLQNKTFASEVKEIEQNGIKAYMMEEHSTPIVSIKFVFQDSGYAHDKKGKFGLANLSAALITYGAGKYDDQELMDLMEETGIRIGFGASKDSLSGSLTAPKANFETAQDLLKQIMFEPHLPEKHLEIKKAQMLKSLEQQKESPKSVLSLASNEQLFGNHPYARNPIGEKNDILSISTDDIREYYKKTFAKNNLIVGIAGDITEEEGKQFLENIFGLLPEETTQKPLEKFEYLQEGRNFNVNREIPQFIATFSAKGTYRENKDFYPLYLANYIFGESGLTSRLNKVLREEYGLTYGIYTYLLNSDSSSLLQGEFSASAEDYEIAKAILLEEWQKMAKQGVTLQELEKAKKSLLDSFNLRFADIEFVSKMMVDMQKYNLGIDFLQKRNDYIRNLTLKEVNDAASRYYARVPDFVTIGPERKEK